MALLALVLFAAAVITPSLPGVVALRQHRTMAITALEDRAADLGLHVAAERYPTARPLEQLASLLVPTYLERLPKEDDWGHRLDFGSNGRSYWLISRGRDGLLDADTRELVGALRDGLPMHDVHVHDDLGDIVFSNGAFRKFPAAGRT